MDADSLEHSDGDLSVDKVPDTWPSIEDIVSLRITVSRHLIRATVRLTGAAILNFVIAKMFMADLRAENAKWADVILWME